jgi:very-short-patch-repair endonuclease
MRKVRNLSPEGKARARELRRNMTESEKKLWDLLRNRRLGFKFRRQHEVLPEFYLDFYCAEAKLCLELDGESHVGSEEYDGFRDKKVSELKIKTLRIPSNDLYEHPEGVVERIWLACKERASGSE